MCPRPARSSREAAGRRQCGERAQCGGIGVPIPACRGRASPSQASTGVQLASLEALHRPPACGPRPRRAARRSSLCAGIRCKSRGRAAERAEPSSRPRSQPGSSGISRAPGGGGKRKEVRHVAGLMAGLESAPPGGRGSRGSPLLPAGLRKILLGQWQAGRRARIGAGALLITVETRAAGNAGGCGAGGGGSPRGGRRRCLGSEHPRVFTGGKSPSQAGGRRAGQKKGTAWGHWEARDIPRAIWLGYS